MARGMPSMVALLGLLAVAGYQNRDKLGDLLNGARNRDSNDPNAPQGGGLQDMLGGVLGSGGLGGLFGQGRSTGGGLGGVLNGGLGELMDRFNGNDHRTKADSWVSTGANEPIGTSDLETALGADTIAELQTRTGLSREELLDRLAQVLPEAVDKMTPDGRLPSAV